MSNLDELKQQLAEIQAKIEKLEKKDTWEMKCPYKDEDDYYVLDEKGLIYLDWWGTNEDETELYSQGNVFSTEEEAELEKKRRNLLTRFRAFRDECNGDWKLKWQRGRNKYLLYVRSQIVEITATDDSDYFTLFGYFKNLGDAQRAIKLFGDEIIELFTEAE